MCNLLKDFVSCRAQSGIWCPDRCMSRPANWMNTRINLVGQEIISIMHLESNRVLRLPLLLPLRERDDDGAVSLVVVRVGVTQGEEELRVAAERAWANSDNMTNCVVTRGRQVKLTQSVIPASSCRASGPPLSTEVEDLELLSIIGALHRVGAQVAQLDFPKVSEVENRYFFSPPRTFYSRASSYLKKSLNDM